MGVALYALVVATALLGSTDLNRDFSPVAVFAVSWIRIAVVSTGGNRSCHGGCAAGEVKRGCR